MIIFHKYFLYKQTFINDYEKYITCVSCIFLSVKICNQLTPLKELIINYIKLYSKRVGNKIIMNEEIIFELSEKINIIEFEILNIIGFDLNIDMPYKYIQQMKFYYFEYLKNSSQMMTITANFINDSFILPLCLYYDPLLIAMSCLYLVSVYFKITLPMTKDNKKWYNIIDDNINYDNIITVSELINKIYKLCGMNKSIDSNELISNDKQIFTFDYFNKINNKCILDNEINRSNLDINVCVSDVSDIYKYDDNKNDQSKHFH